MKPNNSTLRLEGTCCTAMKLQEKPFFVFAGNLVGNYVYTSTTANGNRILQKCARLNGESVVLQIVLRSDQDVINSRHKAYKLLVP